MVNAIITKTNGKDKVIDFRDFLTVAKTEDYAQIHVSGGKDHAPISCIKATICDFSKGTGDKSVTVSANLTVPTVLALYERARACVEKNPSPINNASSVPDPSPHVSKGFVTTLSDVFTLFVNTSKKGGKTLSEEDFVTVGQKLRALCVEVKEAADTAKKLPPAATNLGTPDYTLKQDRVNIYKKGKDGLSADRAPVNRLLITHQTYRQNGELSRYPWTFKITNGNAVSRTSDIGGITYDGSSFVTTNEAFIQVSDETMFNCMVEVKRLIDVFTLTYGIPLLQAGHNLREQERLERQNNAM